MNFVSLKGAALLATGRARGIDCFGATGSAFLASLAPLVAFPLVGAGKMLLSGQPLGALAALLLTLVAQLTPPVISHALAVRWGREAEWMRYATAFNWCQWAIPIALFAMVIALQVAAGSRFPEEQAAKVVVLVIGAYGLWLHWMVARHGLVLSRSRAALLVLLVGLATVSLLMGPHLLQVIVS